MVVRARKRVARPSERDLTRTQSFIWASTANGSLVISMRGASANAMTANGYEWTVSGGVRRKSQRRARKVERRAPKGRESHTKLRVRRL